jgi:hypothetical protein
VKAPTVHLNGTSGQALLDAATDARTAVEAAVVKLRAVYPNARDYYPQGPAAIGQAQDEFIELERKLLDVSEDLLVLAQQIAEQPFKR